MLDQRIKDITKITNAIKTKLAQGVEPHTIRLGEPANLNPRFTYITTIAKPSLDRCGSTDRPERQLLNEAYASLR
jgi:hypothetical protein